MSENKNLDQLIVELANAKILCKQADDRKLQIESAIYELVQGQLTKLGTNHVHPRLKVVTKQNTKYDQDQLAELAKKLPANVFPFKVEYKPDNKQLTALADFDPKAFNAIMATATITPAKPSFEIVVE